MRGRNESKEGPTLLVGETFAIWLQETMEKAMMLMAFVSLDMIFIAEGFNQARLYHCTCMTKENCSLMHAIVQVTKEPLLLHQFLETIAKQLRASGEVTTLDTAIASARLLITIDSDSVATLTKTSDSPIGRCQVKSNF